MIAEIEVAVRRYRAAFRDAETGGARDIYGYDREIIRSAVDLRETVRRELRFAADDSDFIDGAVLMALRLVTEPVK